jgi:hypothetical protein
VKAQNYAASLIPDSLKQNADYVKRYEELRIDVRSSSKVHYYTKYVYTILNEDGDRFGGFSEYYDRFKDISSIDGDLYNALGVKIKSVKKKDITDLSGTDEASFATDIRYKQHDFGYREYPYTVSYEIESETDGILGLPTWIPQHRDKYSLEESKLIVSFSEANPVRFKTNNIGLPDSSIDGSKKTYTWHLKNRPALIVEPYQPSWYTVVPSVKLAPTFITAQGYSGSMNTWKEYGNYIQQLIKDRDALPDDIKTKVHQLVEGKTTVYDKVQTLYEYMQNNTRYISIQMGIGGWQPYDATFVATHRYGDCKALSNYMVALLKEAGIKSNYVEIRSGEGAEPLIEDFPCSQANHVVCCVPNGKDSIWLECTSNYESAGYNGTFTGNRKALAITEDGAKIISTNYYTSKENQQIRKVTAVVDENGHLSAKASTKYTGIEQEDVFGLIHYATKEEREKYLNQMLSIPNYKVEQHEYKETKGVIPQVDEELKIEADNFATVSGKRLFLTPNMFNLMGAKMSTDKARLYPIKYGNDFMQRDTISITIPAGYKVESMAKDVAVTTKFGHYIICFEIDGTKINVKREYERNSITAPSSDWLDFVKFMDQVYKADRSKIAFVKTQSEL